MLKFFFPGWSSFEYTHFFAASHKLDDFTSNFLAMDHIRKFIGIWMLLLTCFVRSGNENSQFPIYIFFPLLPVPICEYFLLFYVLLDFSIWIEREKFFYWGKSGTFSNFHSLKFYYQNYNIWEEKALNLIVEIWN